MAKYCPMCDKYTNCTENCNTCMEEENKMNELINRIQAEHKAYLDRISQLPPKEIIAKAYEICYREEFVNILETTMFSDETIATLLKTPNLLDVLYDEWLKTDASVCEMLEDTIRDFTREEMN